MTDNHAAPTISALLRSAAHRLESLSETARLDAELLLAECLQRNRAYLYTWPEKIPDPATQNKFDDLIDQRAEGIPVAYLTGTREFWSLPFRVNPETLIPRPETERLVELALDILHQQEGPVLDLGTGSGAIAISLGSEFDALVVDAVDQSAAALDIARFNAHTNKVNVHFIQSDWFEQVPRRDYRLIVANPPYIAGDDPHLNRGGLQYEPRGALVSPKNGTHDITCIVSGAAEFMQNSGWLLIEHGATQGTVTQQLMRDAGFQNVRTEQDIEARDRVTLGQR
ncbi:protein-(glutamine-N5) methyltransferase, release factor-specific [Chromatiales bacterium (ex Bugula neritina AB1)]|nr:protein-(glutamine-N5) methyltransferase, release factor-specific [Chromatiales bacterium (ex Bugula neritina AB1)]